MSGDPDSGAVRRIFISHVRADEAWAAWMESVLSAVGVEVSRVDKIAAGEPIVDAVSGLIAEADEVWVVQSAAAARSPNVGFESGQAAARGVPLTYMLVDDQAAAPAGLESARLFDVRSGSLRRLESRLLGAVGRAPRRPTLFEDVEERASVIPGLLANVAPRLRARYPPPALTGRAVARPRLMAALEESLLDDSAADRSVALIGRAASGKTHLAARFVEEHQWRYRDLAWLSVDDLEAALPMVLAGAAELASGEPIGRDASSSERLGRRLLVVVDDVLNAEQLRPLGELPATVDLLVVGCSPLREDVVSRRRFAAVVMEARLDDAEAAEFALRSYPNLGSAEVAKIINVSQGDALLLPVLLRAAASWGDGDALEVLEVLRNVIRGDAGQYFLDTDDPRLIAEWERSFERLSDEGSEVELTDYELGSWRRRWQRRYPAERTEQILDNLERAAEVAALGRPESDANRNNAEAIARLIEASTEIPNLVVVSGSVLLIKVTDERGARVVSKTLTASQLRVFEQNERLSSSPAEALEFLATPADRPPPLPDEL